jgi:4,5-DOPA dioxygenase extradiol
MIVASGNVVHNLRRVQWDRPDAGFDWANRFDDAVASRMEEAPGDILELAEHPDYALAVPTPDHFIPLLYTAGLAAAGEGRAEALVRGYALGSLSMTCYGVGTPPREAEQPHDPAGLPGGVPPDQTNT